MLNAELKAESDISREMSLSHMDSCNDRTSLDAVSFTGMFSERKESERLERAG